LSSLFIVCLLSVIRGWHVLEPNVNGSDRRGLRGLIAGKRSERLKIPYPEGYL
jgi:hypothetical protein